MKLRSLLTLAVAGFVATAATAQPVPMRSIPRNDPNGTYCREYQQMVIVGGQRQNSYGTACQQPDGDWKILPSDVQSQATMNTTIEYIEEPVFISQPVYMAPPPVYYQPRPYYGPRSYPYAYGSGFSVSIGGGDYYRGDRHYHGRGHGHGNWRH